MLCHFHPLTDKVGVLIHKVYDALVVFGVLVVPVSYTHLDVYKRQLYTFGRAVYDIGRNDGSRMDTGHAGQMCIRDRR